jgi:hypothetical protein
MLSDMLVSSSKRYKFFFILTIRMLRATSIVTVDESLMQYQPSAEIKQLAEQISEPIPVVYIPRKPHPNGLLAYVAATYVNHPFISNSKIPYIIDLLPHLQVGDVSAATALEQVMNR